MGHILNYRSSLDIDADTLSLRLETVSIGTYLHSQAHSAVESDSDAVEGPQALYGRRLL